MSNFLNPKYKRAVELIAVDIKEQLFLKRSHWNQLVASYLEEAVVHHGRKAANQLIVDLDLEKHGWEQEGEERVEKMMTVKQERMAKLAKLRRAGEGKPVVKPLRIYRVQYLDEKGKPHDSGTEKARSASNARDKASRRTDAPKKSRIRVRRATADN